MGEGSPTVFDRRAVLSRNELPLQDFAQREDPRLPRAGPEQARQGRPGRRSLTEGILGRAARTGKPAPGRRAAGRPHSDRGEHPVGHGRQHRGRYFQEHRRAEGDLRRKGRRLQPRGDRVLPHRRALGAHVVRAARAARLSRREELRRLVDRVGQLDPGAHREVSTPTSDKASPRNLGEASDFVGTVVDHSALKVNQTGIVATVLVAFAGSALYQPLLVLIPLLAIVLLLGTFAPRLALFKQLYFKVLKPRGIVKPRPVQDRPEPHNFAQGLGGVFLAVASVFLAAPLFAGDFQPGPAIVIGLALSLLVAVLAFVNLAFGYCLG